MSTLRYSRQTILPEIGEEGQLLLKNAHVLVVGAGGLGCPILQYLTAAGVGNIGIVDGDTVNISNLQRQILFDTNDEGLLKVNAAKKHLVALNPEVYIDTYPYFLSVENCLDTLAHYDIVVDGTDNFATRYLINDACVLTHKIHVYGALYKFEGQVSVFNYQQGPTYRCLFPEPPPANTVPNCAEIGVLGVLPGMVGCMQANEVLKIILGIGKVLSGKLWTFDALQNTTHYIQFEKSPHSHQITQLKKNYNIPCATIPEVSYQEYLEWKNKTEVFLIDVRSAREYEQKNIEGHLIPLDLLESSLGQLPTAETIVVHCATGARSARAVELLIEKGFANVYNLKNGLKDVL
jgi:molybdopterin/thiamine biosynthesis adenylyltransferase/rhodanese-related sulfurtransferase